MCPSRVESRADYLLAGWICALILLVTNQPVPISTQVPTLQAQCFSLNGIHYSQN